MQKLLVIFFLCFCLLDASSAEARSKKAKISIAKQKKQNRIANKYKLVRLKNRAQLERSIKKNKLVLVSKTDAYYLDDEIGEWIKIKKNREVYHYALPQVKDFLDTVLTKCYEETGEVFKINSLVRTVAYQKLVRDNEGGAIMGKKWWQKSLHLTGAAVDISYGGGVTSKGRACLRKRLRELEKDDKVVTIYESDHFHIFVSPEYK